MPPLLSPPNPFCPAAAAASAAAFAARACNSGRILHWYAAHKRSETSFGSTCAITTRGAALHPHSKDSLKLFHCSMYELEAVALHAATFPKILVRPLTVATIPELSWIIVVFSPLRACVLPAQQEQCDIQCISLMLHVTSIITLVSLEREAWAEQRT